MRGIILETIVMVLILFSIKEIAKFPSLYDANRYANCSLKCLQCVSYKVRIRVGKLIMRKQKFSN